MRWLGVHFDPRLSFAHDDSIMATKGRQTGVGLTMLGNTTRRVDLVIMRKCQIDGSGNSSYLSHSSTTYAN